ncbi:MAG: 50S ribosomal protein L24 [Alphaproteobacteria bacterium]|nr:50S ribosomal protein L24 [Alphaproteobacteria bacterium]
MVSRVKKGDFVIVTAGKHKGAKGQVMKVFTAINKVTVKGVNILKRNMKPRQGNPGGVVEKEGVLDLSNIMLMDPKTHRPTRVGVTVLDNGKKVRYAKVSRELIDDAE